MQVIKKINGYVYLVENADRKGFETFYNLGKDPDDERWNEKPKQKKGNEKKDE